MAETLKVNTTFREVYLQNKSIGDAGCVALVDALKVNTSGAVVKLEDNTMISNGGWAALAVDGVF